MLDENYYKEKLNQVIPFLKNGNISPHVIDFLLKLLRHAYIQGSQDSVREVMGKVYELKNDFEKYSKEFARLE